MRTPRFYFWITVSLLAILAVAFGSNAHSQLRVRPPAFTSADDHDYDSSEQVKEQETIHKSFSLPAGERSLEIDNINGSIEVTGSQTNEVQVVVNETIRAKSKEKLEQARKEVSLDATQEGGAVKLYVNGPFRCGHDCSHSENHGYSVSMDFHVQAPRDVAVKLKSVNGGIEVKDVTGKYSVHTVNGKIGMENVAASGVAHTVNGAVKILYRDNPRENSEFASVNGGIELYFAPNLSADFHFKNLNGGIFTDFPMTSLADSASQGEMHDGKFVYRGHGHVAGRVGAGGPEIKAENVNGSIRVLERHD
jgi:DUF4097 and DUF4098 domain-containing protein YvlB